MKKRISAHAGIAIGPLLFVIALLAVLAGAIAAGSGSFTASTANEETRADAAALIQIGDNLRRGFEFVQRNVAFTSIVIDPAQTTGTGDLFSPTGGSILPPSNNVALDPQNDLWRYPYVIFEGLGTNGTAGAERLAMLRISSGTCTAVNALTVGIATPAAFDFGDPAAGTVGAPLDMSTAWPNALAGKQVGCINNDTSNNTLDGTYFYQVMGIR